MNKILVKVSITDFSTISIDNNGNKWISVERIFSRETL